MASHEIPKVTEEFKRFISSLLRRGGVGDKSILLFTDDESMLIFRKAFTHKTYHPKFNYETLEFFGDVVVNLSISQYIRVRFPKIRSIRWLTKIKHNLVSKTFLARLAEAGDFLKHLKYKELDDDIRDKSEKYLSMMEDSFEAFIGATVKVIENKKRRGVGYAIAYNIIKGFYDGQHISLRWEDVFDSKSRLKELYDSLGWPVEQLTSTWFDQGRNVFVTQVQGMPNKRTIKIASMNGGTHSQSVEAASSKAIYTLRRKYRIYGEPSSPYLEEEEFTLPAITDDFAHFMRSIFKDINISASSISTFTKEENLLDLRLSLVEDQNRYSKFRGIPVVDLIIAEHLRSRFPRIISEKWLTNIKHKIISRGTLTRIAKEIDIERYFGGESVEVMLEKNPDKEKNREYMNALEGAFKALIGAIVEVVDREKMTGVGFAVAYRFLNHYLSRIHVSLDYKDVFDAKTRLKELFDKYQWNLDRNINFNFDSESRLFTAEVFGYPKGNRRLFPENKFKLGTGTGRTKQQAIQSASTKAITTLSRKFKIKEFPPYQYETD